MGDGVPGWHTRPYPGYRDDREDRDDGAYNNMCDDRGDGNSGGGCGNDSNKPGGPLTRDCS